MTISAYKSELQVPSEPTTVVDVPKPRRRRPYLLYLSVAWLILVIFLAVFASVLPIAHYSVPVGPPRTGPSMQSLDLLLGTDNLGRSMLARLISGARVSLVVSVVAGGVGLLVGSTIGIVAGYFGGWTDRLVGLVVDALLAFPPLVLLLALASTLTPSLETILIGLTVMVVPVFVRLARSATISVRSREYVRAAVSLGATHRRILWREILPQVVAPLLAYLPVVLAALIVAEGSLSFLGLGIPPPQPSWGGSVNDGRTFLTTDPGLMIIPAVAVFLAVFSLNQVGDHLRRKYDQSTAR